MFQTILNIFSPHEEIMYWPAQFVCPGTFTLVALTSIAVFVNFNFLAGYSYYQRDQEFTKWVVLFFKLFKTTLQNGFKVFYQPWLPICFSLFFWFYFTNLCSVLPFTASLTTCFPIIFICTLMTFGVANVMGVYQNKLKFLNLFLPTGAPMVMSFLLVPVEIIAYGARLISLTVRLFANMLAGYILMEMFFSFFLMMMNDLPVNYLSGLIILVLIFLIAILKILIAFLQAFIFSLLLSFYLNDPIKLH